MTRGKTVEEKVGEWKRAFDLIAPELNPQALRDALDSVINTPIPADPEGLLLYENRMLASLGLGRMVAANDRAAGTIAALIVANGIKPADINYGDDA